MERPATLTEAFEDEDSKIMALSSKAGKVGFATAFKNSTQKSETQNFPAQLKPSQHLLIWPKDTPSSHCYFDLGHANLNSTVTDLPCCSQSKVLVKHDEPT